MSRDTDFHSVRPLDPPFCHIFKNTCRIKVSKDNSRQSGALGMWPRSTIFGSDYHDLGQGVLPILEFTGSSIALDIADCACLSFKIQHALFFCMKYLFQDKLWCKTQVDILVVCVFLLNILYIHFDLFHYNSHLTFNCLAFTYFRVNWMRQSENLSNINARIKSTIYL